MNFVALAMVLTALMVAPLSSQAKGFLGKFDLPMTREMHPRMLCKNLMQAEDPVEIRKRVLTGLDRLNELVPGQRNTNFKVIVTAVAGGHLLLVGPKGVAKTRTSKKVAELFGGTYSKVDVKGDMMPQSVLGKIQHNDSRGVDELIKSLLPYQFVLLDEANRGSERLQSAFLQAMVEGEFQLDDYIIPLPLFNMFIAAQNPDHYKGTTGLGEALLDRFLMQVNVPYPDSETEKLIVRLVEQEKRDRILNPGLADESIAVASPEDLLMAKLFSLDLEISAAADAYIETLIQLSRVPGTIVDSKLKDYLQEGLGPRVSIDLTAASRSAAWLEGSDTVERSHVEMVVNDVIRHRILLTEIADRDGVSVDEVIRRLKKATLRSLEPKE